jgi:TPR repeat protein
VSPNQYAFYNLAGCYLQGLGTPKSDTQALYWLKLSAAEDVKEAQYLLGCCYEKGIGGATALEEALDRHGRAAVNGCSASQLRIEYYKINLVLRYLGQQ